MSSRTIDSAPSCIQAGCAGVGGNLLRHARHKDLYGDGGSDAAPPHAIDAATAADGGEPLQHLDGGLVIDRPAVVDLPVRHGVDDPSQRAPPASVGIHAERHE